MTKLTSATVALMITLLTGCAGPESVDGTTQVGQVQGVYVERFRGVFVDRQVAGDRGGATAWAYVTFTPPLADGRTFVTGELPGELDVEPGDLVRLRFGHDASIAGTPFPGHASVIALVAKHDTQAAREHDLHAQRSIQGQRSASGAGLLSSLPSE